MVYAVFRPLAAFVSGIFGGFIVELFDRNREEGNSSHDDSPKDECCDAATEEEGNKFVRILRYAFVDLLDDIAPSFVVGLLLAALISITIPDNWFVNVLGTGFLSMIVMMLMGIPLYVCATASVPIAAAFIAKGVTPGAALVFLIAGPATNAAAIAALIKILGKKETLLYLFSIAFTALVSGMALDSVYTVAAVSPGAVLHEHCSLSFVEIGTGGLLLLLLLVSIARRHILPRFRKTEVSGDEIVMIFDVRGMSCSHCAATVKSTLETLPELSNLSIDLSTKKISIKTRKSADYSLVSEQIQRLLKEKGFEAILKK